MSSSFLQMAVESRDLSQEIAICKTEEIHKITTQNFEWKLLSLLFLFELEINKWSNSQQKKTRRYIDHRKVF